MDDYDGLGLPVDNEASKLDDEPDGERSLGLILDQPVPLASPELDPDPLDVGAVLPVGPETQALADDDAPGLPQMQEELEGADLADAIGDQAEPVWDDDAWVPSGDLPQLDRPERDADGEGVSPQEDRWGVGEDPRDEQLPEYAPVWWHERFVPGTEVPCQTLALGLGVVVGAGQNLYWWAGSAATPTLSAGHGGRIESLVLVGQTRQYVLCATTQGTLVVCRQDGTTEVIDTWRQFAGKDPRRIQRLDLCQLGDDCPPVVLGRTSGGALLRSLRGGTDWQCVPVRGRVRALSAHGSPVVAVGQTSDKTLLWWSSDQGITFMETELESEARQIAEGDTPMLCAVEDTVALAHPDRGLVVSTDRGRSFRRVPGCAGTTAVAAGQLEGNPAVFAALLLQSEDRTELVVVSPERAEAQRVGSILPPSKVGEAWDDSVEHARVNAMRWDADSRCLWVAGSFGLTSWFPPRPTDA